MVGRHFRTYFSGDWDVHWGYGILTHGHLKGRSIGYLRSVVRVSGENNPLEPW